jgi:hypothetical protein
VTPEEVVDSERASSIEHALIVHALPSVPGVTELIDGLAQKVVHVERDYKLRKASNPRELNVLWLTSARESGRHWNISMTKPQGSR